MNPIKLVHVRYIQSILIYQGVIPTKYIQMKDRLGDFKIKVNCKFQAIVREVYSLGFSNNTKRARRLLKDYSFIYKQAEKVYAF